MILAWNQADKMIAQTEKTIREIAIDDPASVRVFESLGIDYCCGGKLSLREGCARANVSLDEALRLLALAEEQTHTTETNWPQASVRELTTHIVDQHHEYVRREATRLLPMLDKVVTRHGAAHPEVKPIQEPFQALSEEMLAHMAIEENILFPYLVSMETAIHEGRRAPRAMFGSVEAPIGRMFADHDAAADLAARIRILAADFQPPQGACPTYRGLYHGLEEFERDLHRHVHLENNILFPRALEMERKAAADVHG